MSQRFEQYAMLNALCPMHIVVGAGGTIVSAGPTINKISPQEMIGFSFQRVFDLKRPKGVAKIESLKAKPDTKVSLQFRSMPDTQLKGLLTKGPVPDQLVINLSFGISVVEAVQQFNLTAADFAPTDLTVEMLYLVEAKSAAMEASRELNKRLQAARDAAEEQARTDMLTGLQNRRAMERKLSDLIDARVPFALMQVDLDYFKRVNDTLGHGAGDLVLCHVGQVMTEATRKNDVVARVGGDEFVVLLQTSEDRTALSETADRIIHGIQKPVKFDDKLCAVSGSIGIVLSKDYDVPSADQMLKDADTALYEAKHRGRGNHIFFERRMRDERKSGELWK